MFKLPGGGQSTAKQGAPIDKESEGVNRRRPTWHAGNHPNILRY